jgi:hypothetical protein
MHTNVVLLWTKGARVDAASGMCASIAGTAKAEPHLKFKRISIFGEENCSSNDLL